jgi:uncharacterized protein YjbJ (UPF0337 family)
MDRFLRALLKTGAYFLDQAGEATTTVREKVRSRAGDLTDRTVQVIRGPESHVLRDAIAFTAGVGLGVGVGILCAPSSGAQTRGAISGRLQEFGGNVKKRVSSEMKGVAAGFESK